jgi:hypothetical protein
VSAGVLRRGTREWCSGRCRTGRALHGRSRSRLGHGGEAQGGRWDRRLLRGWGEVVEVRVGLARGGRGVSCDGGSLRWRIRWLGGGALGA